MKKSFTLIEVMIAVTIIFMVISVVLDISSNIKHLFNISKKNFYFELKSSVTAIEDKNSKNIYEKVTEFNISNDMIIKILKQDKQDKKIVSKTIHNIIDIEINKIKIYNDKHSINLYGVKIK